MSHPLILAATVAILMTAPVAAMAEDASDKVVVIVAIPTPPGATDAVLKAEFDKAAPRYQQIPGLIRKYFTTGNGKFGGVYYWSSKAAADAWFNDAWKARVAATYHAPADVTYYTVPLAIEGAHP
jgi:heme-degrading monooxygenase HmoA